MIQYQLNFISDHKQNKSMIEPIFSDQQGKEFLLKDQLKAQEINTIQFLYNSDFLKARQNLDEKIAIQTEIKKYQRSVSINTEELKLSFHALSEKLRQKYLRQDSECLKALNKLQSLWQTKKIQIFHRFFFEKYILSTSLKNALTLIKNQDHLMRIEQHIYFCIEKAIWAREACMNHLKRQLKVLGPQDVYEHLQTLKDREIEKNRKIQQKLYKVYGYRAKYVLDERDAKLGETAMEKISEDINNYRKITYHLIELICSWKMYIQSLTNDLRLKRQKLEFYYKEYNHMLAILNDTSFVSTSFLSHFYKFSIKNDPFLLKPILNIEKSIEEGLDLAFQAHQLKKIMDCKLEDVPKITLALNQLAKEVEWNLIHKKYSEKKGFLKSQSTSLKKQTSEGKLPSLKSIKLSNLSPQSSIRKSQTQLKKEKSASLTKSNVLMRKASLMSDISVRSTFRNQNFRINNPESKKFFKLINSQQLMKLKSDIYRKVKEQLEIQTKKSIIESKMFSDLIDEQVKVSFQRHLNDQQKQALQNLLEITPLSFSQQEVSSFLTQAYKQIPDTYQQLQIMQSDLMKEINQVNYLYLLKVHTQRKDVANIVAFCNRQSKDYKSIEIKLISFKSQESLQKIVLKLIEFLWKYDNAKEIFFNLRFKSVQTQQLVQSLAKRLQQNCTVIEKRFKEHVQVRFIFFNKEFNKKYVHNPHPQKVHFKMYSALSIQNLHLQTIQMEDAYRHLNYDYLIMEILKRFTNSEDFSALRNSFKSKSRLRFLLTQLMEIQDHKEYQVDMTILQDQSIISLNHQLKQMKKPLLQVSDLVTINNIKMIQLQYTLTIAYRMQVASTWKGQKCHRYAINEEISNFCDKQGTQFYLLPVQESKHLKIIIFSAENYLKNYKKGLNMYLFQTLEQNQWKTKHVKGMWIEMMKYPKKYTERQQFFLNSFRSHEFDSINKDLIIGDALQWFTDIQIQNGIQYLMHQNDLHMKKPLGVGVITNKNWILYCRIIEQDQQGIPENA